MTVSTTFARLARQLLNRGSSGDFAVPETTREAPGYVYYQMAGKKRKAHGTWYRGETTNFHPMRASLAEPDAVLKYVGHGWFPAQPFITKNHYITAFGSCFAAEVTKFLVAEGYSVFGKDLTLNAHVVRSGEGITSSAALRQQFEWAFCNQAPINPVWYEKDGTAAAATGPIRDATRQIFDATDVFIFTLGLSEVWYDKLTDEVFWRAVPSQVYDPERHGFRVLGTDENRANLKRVYELIRLHRPEASIIFTLSPVPLAATFRPVSCITANSVSKASLRVAIDELMRENEADAGLHYFPSYEIVKDFLESPVEDDLRHPTRKTVDFIMRTFQRSFLM
jgi:hypothetical protein